MKKQPPPAYWFMNVGEGLHTRPGQEDEIRLWEDCVQYGFMAMGNGEYWIKKAHAPAVGEYLFAFLSECGYVGYGVVDAIAVPFKDFVPSGESQSLMHLPLKATATPQRMNDPTKWDMCIRVRWLKTVERTRGIKGIWNYTGTLCSLDKDDIIAVLLQKFDPAHERA